MKNASAYFDKNGLHEIESLSISLFAKIGESYHVCMEPRHSA